MRKKRATYRVDSPASGFTVAEGGRIHVAGWCFDSGGKPAREVRVRLGGVRTVCEPCARPDVNRMFAATVRSEARVGFIGSVAAPSGFRMLFIEAQLRDGASLSLGQRLVLVRPVASERSPRAADRLAHAKQRLAYARWIKTRDVLSKERCAAMRRQVEQFDYLPRISVVMPTYNTPRALLDAAISSVQSQLYENWEFCIADDASTQPHVGEILERCARTDSRIRVVRRTTRGNISVATNAALALGSGEFVVLLDHDDELRPHALYEIVQRLNDDRDLDVIYSDQDKIDDHGNRFEPFFKPDWSPEYFRSVMYVGHLLCVRRALLDEVGGLDSHYDGVQDFELMLRLSERTRRIGHIPVILYHWRAAQGSIASVLDAKSEIDRKQAFAVGQHLRRMGIAADAKALGGHRVEVVPQYRRDCPLISIIIPTKDRPDLLGRCLASLYERSTYRAVEIILGDNDTTDKDALDIMRKYPVKRVPFPGRFNFSRVNNICARASSGTFLVFLNNDTEVITSDWLERMLFYAEQPEVGAVGAHLLYPDGTTQHAGVVLGMRGSADHCMRGLVKGSDGYFGSLAHPREVTAVTAACLMVKRTLFESVRGFCEHYFTHYQDVDLCCRFLERGHRNLFVPHAVLRHFESASRKAYYDLVDRYLLLDRWGSWIAQGDRYYNPHLDLERGDYTLGWQ